MHHNIILKISDTNDTTIKEDTNTFVSTTRDIIRTSFNHLKKIICYPFNLKTLKIRMEFNNGIRVFGIVINDNRLFGDFHIITVVLGVFFTMNMVNCFNHKFGAVNIGQFSTITVFTTNKASYAFFVIRGSEQMTENHIRDIDIFGLMLTHWNTITVIFNTNETVLLVNRNPNIS